MLTRKQLIPIIVLCILLEVGFNVYFNISMFSQVWTATGLFCASLLVGIITLYSFYGRKVVKINPPSLKPIQYWGIAVLWICLATGFCIGLAHKFIEIPIDPKYSDVIPTIQIAVNRLLTGEYVYNQIVKFEGYQLPLTYLPMQWLPYIPAEIGHFDYRWIAIGINCIAVLWLLEYSIKNGTKNALLTLGLVLFNYLMIRKFNVSILTLTVEMMVAGYYIALIIGINSKSAVLRGAVIALCLLSRYSLVLWLPLWFFVELISGDRKKLGITTVVVTLLIVCIYIIPFLSRDPGIFLRGYSYYSNAALGEWTNLNADKHPYHLYNGQGFAWLFYSRLTQYPIEMRIKYLQMTHLLLCTGGVVIMGIWYWFKRAKIDYRIFLLGSFKIYLSIFLAFIQVPYAYLMITGSFVSIALLAVLLRYKIAPLNEEDHLVTAPSL